jgi:anti-sigma28 factor (negative regulator of flagellin synthesis)
METPKPDAERGPGPPSPGERWKKIARLREEIRRGTYDDPAKWERILDRLLKDVAPPS